MQKIIFLAVIAVIAFVCAIPTANLPTTTTTKESQTDITFEEFCAKYNKHYHSHEYEFRKALFTQNALKVAQHNAANKSYTKELNQFADRTTAELSRMFGYSKTMARSRRALRASKPQVEVRSEYFKANSVKYTEDNYPTSFDWTAFNATTPVKNQGGCGSCWAFAGTEALESNVYLETGKLIVLAPQAYVDCVANPNKCGGSGGCEGATADLLYEYAQSKGGCYETDYPYTASDGQCHSFPQRVSIKSWVDVPQNDDSALLLAVLQQPVTISVAASSWSLYSGGVFGFTDCDADVNHVVLLVGYGTDPQFGDYWKVQNSWGPTWGENGFIRLQRTSQCAIDKNPGDGNGCAGGPSEISVCGTCGMLSDTIYPTGGSVGA